jgi:hypothetical protein
VEGFFVPFVSLHAITAIKRMQYGAIYRSRQEEELANSLFDLPVYHPIASSRIKKY